MAFWHLLITLSITNYLTSLRLSFPYHKMGVMKTISKFFFIYVWKTLSPGPNTQGHSIIIYLLNQNLFNQIFLYCNSIFLTYFLTSGISSFVKVFWKWRDSWNASSLLQVLLTWLLYYLDTEDSECFQRQILYEFTHAWNLKKQNKPAFKKK